MAALWNDGKRNSSGRFRTCLEVVKNREVEPMKANSLDIFIFFRSMDLHASLLE